MTSTMPIAQPVVLNDAPPSYSEAIGDEVSTEQQQEEEGDGLFALRALASSVSEKMFGSPQLEERTEDIAAVVPRTLATIRITIAPTGGYIAQVDLPCENIQNKQNATARIGPFGTEAIAWTMARSFAPAVWQPPLEGKGGSCGNCRHTFAVFRRCHHCRNCGLAVCSRCSVHWPSGTLPESALCTDVKSFAKAAKIFADRLPTTSTPQNTNIGSKQTIDAIRAWSSRTTVRVCLACDKAAADVRRAMLAGIPVAEAQQKLNSGEWANVNFQRPLAKDFHLGGLLPIHAAVASGSLPLVQWLVQELDCPVDGAMALTAGTPPKSVLRIAVEHAATEILEWLLFTDSIRLPYHELPLELPPSLDVATPVALRALSASLRDAHKLRHLLDQVLTDAAPLQQNAFNVPSAAFAASSLSSLSVPTAPLAEQQSQSKQDETKQLNQEQKEDDAAKECTVCFSPLIPEVRCALVPCGHTSCCQECAGSLATCPLCRTSVDRVMRIFVED
uniref:RING-type domain-containing protein n=1 Tax=Aureoumbra lagunensis TaxID=44058 RepID=A0A7S3JSJ0_9STRA|mmetsp:Transcript_17437/g.22699  ORF Transcript_17437/g.22699 Transcript_17437/m.22699 type:complete len:503 (-) Transcript_17437:277-1785(-)